MLTLLLLSLSACNKDAETPAEKPAASKAVPADAGEFAAPADCAAPPAEAVKSESGLASKVITPGTGTTHPTAEDTVEVNYTGWTKDGEMFDSSAKRHKTAKFPLNGVIKGWTEGVQLMVEGEKRRFWIPANLAYGETPQRPGAPSGQLTFDIELVSIKSAPKPLPAPADVAAAPKDAKVTKSGLAYKVLTPGTGTAHPKSTETVEVNYTGWTKDGKMFDSSVVRGETATFPLDHVIPGWTEGLQLMVVGETTRFWIPSEMAYGDPPKRPGAPAGQLTFDIELKAIK